MIDTLSNIPRFCRWRSPEEIAELKRAEFRQKCLVIAIGFLMAAGAVATAISKLS